MKIIREVGKDELAKVYIAELEKGQIEFAESVQPPLTRKEKWVIIISCLVGCPARCLMCDAGKKFSGKMTKDEILEQIDYLVDKRFPEGKVDTEKFKIQFTRMGEPAFNSAVLEVLRELPIRYDAPNIIPSVSSIGPQNYMKFFDPLRDIKNELYGDGKFQMQFSIHTTDMDKRDVLIPIPKMSFEEIGEYGESFYVPGDRKITLNFVMMEDYPVEADVIEKHFSPDKFLVKLTPLNPTGNAEKNDLSSALDPHDESSVGVLVSDLKSKGFDVIVSIGELEENEIGSNCGQYVSV
ncbi:radical SAM protein [Candidatus Peribacteria bacterium]|nr:radical SAM protein [Candidatus Peribacteria bacterium]MBT4021275.1 radical SAM protein [Candidatus Peribacteria bacterium]MBT4240660.1 radical SAM protein [Candidatus Peribacteria bacterium]MBT4474005.1 radical SAM protein [Candidatus Peribacteria bacterium]